jgi:predicted phosphodiesterase
MATKHEPAIIEGIVAFDEKPDADALWSAAEKAQTIARKRQAAQRQQRITLPAQPVAIAFLSDFHIGNAGTDYASLRADCTTIAKTPGMYAMFAGDGVDNWIIGKLANLQHHQALNYDSEWLLFETVLQTISEKLLVVVAGNHDNWTYKISHIDRLRDILTQTQTLYDRQQVSVTLEHGKRKRLLLIRHKWRGNSIFNVTHAIEVGYDRLGVPYDWGIGGHTHIGTYCREFDRHGQRRSAILLGTYKLIDPFGAEIGVAPTAGIGCGAKVLHPDGREWWFTTLDESREFLEFLRRKF